MSVSLPSWVLHGVVTCLAICDLSSCVHVCISLSLLRLPEVNIRYGVNSPTACLRLHEVKIRYRVSSPSEWSKGRVSLVEWTVVYAFLFMFAQESYRPLKIRLECEFSVLCAFGYLVDNPLRV